MTERVFQKAYEDVLKRAYELRVNCKDMGDPAKTIMEFMTGVTEDGLEHRVPSTLKEWSECWAVLKSLPEWLPWLEAMADRHPEWNPFVDHWDDLDRLYLEKGIHKATHEEFLQIIGAQLGELEQRVFSNIEKRLGTGNVTRNSESVTIRYVGGEFRIALRDDLREEDRMIDALRKAMRYALKVKPLTD